MAALIPIQNLYYLLCYAWGLPEQRDWVSVDAHSCPAVVDLLSRLLTKGAEVLLKRGIAKEYCTHEEEIAGIKGKLELAQTLKQNRYREGKTICTLDELTGDILLNQIVYTSMYRLLSDKELDKDVRSDLRRTFLRFPKVAIISLGRSTFKDVRLNRNNRFYRLILNVCELLYERLLPEQDRPGEYKFMDFTRDENKMNAIFESFLLNFYRQECAQEYPIVKRSIIHFQLTALEEEDEDLLPEMITDVTLDNPDAGKRIILDAKYYKEMLTSRFETAKKLRRDHISQITSYVNNQEDKAFPYTLSTKGIMVYPKTGIQEETFNFAKDAHKYRFCTVDLAQDWHLIHQRLLTIIQF